MERRWLMRQGLVSQPEVQEALKLRTHASRGLRPRSPDRGNLHGDQKRRNASGAGPTLFRSHMEATMQKVTAGSLLFCVFTF